MTSPYPPTTPTTVPTTTPTSSTDPDQIRREIERTQAAISTDVDALTEKVSPGRIAQRRIDRVRNTASDWRDQVMGSNAIPGTTQSAASTVSDTASTVQGAVQEAPKAIVRQTRGNPLAAGLIAFGAGWLVSSLLPASKREQELAEQAKQHASELGQPIAQAAKEAASDMKDHLQEPAQQAVESVRASASDAGRTVTEQGRSAAQDVQGRAQDAAGTVQQSTR